MVPLADNIDVTVNVFSFVADSSIEPVMESVRSQAVRLSAATTAGLHHFTMRWRRISSLSPQTASRYMSEPTLEFPQRVVIFGTLSFPRCSRTIFYAIDRRRLISSS